MMGNEDTVHLPNNIHGKTYSIFKMRGVKHVVVPEGITEISQSAFEECETLESIVISLKCSLSSKYLKSPPAARSLKIACLCGFNRPRRFCAQ